MGLEGSEPACRVSCQICIVHVVTTGICKCIIWYVIWSRRTAGFRARVERERVTTSQACNSREEVAEVLELEHLQKCGWGTLVVLKAETLCDTAAPHSRNCCGHASGRCRILIADAQKQSSTTAYRTWNVVVTCGRTRETVILFPFGSSQDFSSRVDNSQFIDLAETWFWCSFP